MWRKPQVGWFKINTDGSKSDSHSDYGEVIRDPNGGLLVSFNQPCMEQPIHVTELRGALAGLKCAFNLLGYQAKFWLEMDSQLCLAWSSRRCKPPWTVRAVITHIWALLEKATDNRVSHTWREGNRAADILAKDCHPTPLAGIMVFRPPASLWPHELIDILKEDDEGKVYYRDVH